MKKNIMEYGWDGEWFLRAYDDFGKKMGSHECEEGKIFIERRALLLWAAAVRRPALTEGSGERRQVAELRARSEPEPAGIHQVLHPVR